MIGKSLSFCVRDIAQGKVNIEDVEKIVAGTRFRTKAEFIRLLERYKALYWEECADEAVEIARTLYAQGKIDQPRLRGENPPNPSTGIWEETEVRRGQA